LRRLRSKLRSTLSERFDQWWDCPSVVELDHLISVAKDGNVVVDEQFYEFI
jgi:hypothetical protein